MPSGQGTIARVRGGVLTVTRRPARRRSPTREAVVRRRPRERSTMQVLDARAPKTKTPHAARRADAAARQRRAPADAVPEARAPGRVAQPPPIPGGRRHRAADMTREEDDRIACAEAARREASAHDAGRDDARAVAGRAPRSDRRARLDRSWCRRCSAPVLGRWLDRPSAPGSSSAPRADPGRGAPSGCWTAWKWMHAR